MSVSFICLTGNGYAQEPMIGQQNGETWRGLVIGTQAETTSRKTFYVEGMYNMCAFWSQHTPRRHGAVDYDDAFIGISVGQIRDGLDSLYSSDKNLQIPIVDGVLIVRLWNAGIPESKVDQVVDQLRRATVNGTDPTEENKIWKEGLFLLE